MGFLKNLDLYKIVILLSILLLPASIGYVYWIEGQLTRAKTAMQMAERRGNGEIERIGRLCRQLETIQRNASRSGYGETEKLYFERIIVATARADAQGRVGITSSDFQIQNKQDTNVVRERAIDWEVPIAFQDGGKPKPLPREFIHAMLINCEQEGAQVWKLRALEMRNVQGKDFVGRGKGAPPRTIEDDWEIRRLVFARREPART
ncbi:MAG: hypothetical protein IPM29_09095 [Planctomycetes bacterium]|nr:hypothetical protein [Planctomycetota bacterium]